jgi:radical SAM-linked protein
VQLPWDHIDTLVKREFNAREYMKGIKAKISPPCELPIKIIDGRPTAIAPSNEEFERVASQPLLCYACGLECDLTKSREHLGEAHSLHREVRTYEARIANMRALLEQPLVELVRSSTVESQRTDTGSNDSATRKGFSESRPATLPRYRATFEKGEEVKYLSHLDLTRALPRAFRRAKIRLGYSQGYHPMPLIQYGPALGVGTVGCNELIDFDSPEMLTEAEFLNRMNGALPQGLRFKSLRSIPVGGESLMKGINRAEYSVSLRTAEIEAAVKRIRSERSDFEPMRTAEIHTALFEEFIARESCVIERVRKDKRQRVDVRRYTRALSLIENQTSVSIITEVTPSGGVKPIEVMAAIYDLTETETISLSSRVRRLRLYSEDQLRHPAGLIQGMAAAP